MAFAEVTYTVSAALEVEFAIPFPFLRDNNISVEVNGSTAGVTFTIASTKDELEVTAPALLENDLVTIRRATPLANSDQYVNFSDPATPRRDDLETMRKQLLYSLQELDDANTSGLQLDLADSKWEALGRIIKNVMDPVDDQDAATKLWVETAFTTGGVLPTPGLSTALYFLRVNSLGSGYVLSPSLGERYLFKVISQGSGPVGWNNGWVLPAFASGFTDSSQRAPLELVDSFNDLGLISLNANTFDLTIGAGQWEIEVTGHLRGLTDTANTNISDGQLAITGSTGATVYASSPEIITGYAVQVQDSGAAIIKTGPASAQTTVRYFANFAVNTVINLRGKGSTSSHSVVADIPTYLRIHRVTR